MGWGHWPVPRDCRGIDQSLPVTYRERMDWAVLPVTMWGGVVCVLCRVPYSDGAGAFAAGDTGFMSGVPGATSSPSSVSPCPAWPPTPG